MEKKTNEIGNYSIAEKVYTDIADIVCSNIKNIYPIKKDNVYAECKFNKQKELVIDVALRIKQGTDIIKLCNRIQNDIKDNILLMTGIEVKRVNIDIQGFETKK